MKTQKIFCFLTLVMLFSVSAFAKTWTVDNKSNSISDYTEIQAAHDAASDGDTIRQTDTRPAICDYFTFNDGSEGSLLTGFHINCASYHSDAIKISTDNIIIKRNVCDESGANIKINQNHSNIIISGNYFNSNGIYETITVGSNCNNIQINNNYIDSGDETDFCIKSDESSAVTIWNNVLYGKVEIYNSVFYNNILRDGIFSGTNSAADINHNIGDDNQFGTSYGNQQNVLMSTVFNLTGSTDGQFQLKTGSPAIAAGLNGEDCGMFGGTTPYILSGLPSIPSIYFFVAPSSASGTEGLQVQIKAKSNN